MLNQSGIKKVYAQLERDHARLQQYGVKLPSLIRGKQFNAKALELIILRHNIGELVSKTDMTAFVRAYVNGADDIQPRHLNGTYGWDVRLSGKARHFWTDGTVMPRGFYGLAQVITPSATFKQFKRLGMIHAKDWDDLLDKYGHACASCHKTGVPLEKGHKDPSKSLIDIDNVIPVCMVCNNQQSNDVVLDNNGRVYSLATPALVRKSSYEVRLAIFEELKKEFDINEI